MFSTRRILKPAGRKELQLELGEREGEAGARTTDLKPVSLSVGKLAGGSNLIPQTIFAPAVLDTHILVCKCPRLLRNSLCWSNKQRLFSFMDFLNTVFYGKNWCLGICVLLCFVFKRHSTMRSYLKGRELGEIFYIVRNMRVGLSLLSHGMHVCINIISEPAGSLWKPSFKLLNTLINRNRLHCDIC